MGYVLLRALVLLLSFSEDELDKVIDSQHFGIHKHLGMIADSMAEWEGPIANQLQLSPADVAMIKTKHPSHLKLQWYVM